MLLLKAAAAALIVMAVSYVLVEWSGIADCFDFGPPSDDEAALMGLAAVIACTA